MTAEVHKLPSGDIYEETRPGDGILCPHCGHPHQTVVDSRPRENLIRRRRKCLGCGFRFNTHEYVLGSVEHARLIDRFVGAIEKALDALPAARDAVRQLDGDEQ